MLNAANLQLASRVDLAKLEPFLDIPGVLFCLVDSRGNLIGASESWFSILGYKPKDLESLNLLDIVHHDDLERTLGDEPWIDRPSARDGYSNRCRHKDGTYRWVRWHTQQRTDLKATYAIGIDITNTTDASGEKPKISSPGSPRTNDQILFEANPNPMWVYDRETLRFLEVNDAAIDHYGFSRSEFLSMTLLDIRPLVDREAVVESVQKDSIENIPKSWTHIKKNGEAIQIEVMVRNIQYLGYNARLASVKDITDQIRTQQLLEKNNELLEMRVLERTEQLVAANQELEAFCFSVSHDLRAPLRAIDGFTHSILKSLGDEMSPETRSDLDRVRNASKKMSELIDALLGLTRLTRQEINMQKVDLSSLATQILLEAQVEDPTRNVKWRIQPGLEVNADPQLMLLLLQNLLSNAWKFTRNVAKAEISFEAQDSAGERIFAIRDNGAGFDMAYVDKLFHPFQRLHHSSEFPGNGIGLAIVSRIVRRHGGRAFAHGLTNHGATVYFTLSYPGKPEDESSHILSLNKYS